jgi:hypothetical protein
MLNIINTFFEIRKLNYFVKNKKISKKLFLNHHFKNFIVKLRRGKQTSIDNKGILSRASQSEEAPNIQEATGSNSIQVK